MSMLGKVRALEALLNATSRLDIADYSVVDFRKTLDPQFDLPGHLATVIEVIKPAGKLSLSSRLI